MLHTRAHGNGLGQTLHFFGHANMLTVRQRREERMNGRQRRKGKGILVYL